MLLDEGVEGCATDVLISHLKKNKTELAKGMMRNVQAVVKLSMVRRMGNWFN